MNDRPPIKDPRLDEQKQEAPRGTAKQEHEQGLESRQQEHSHTVEISRFKHLAWQTWFSRAASAFLCLIIIVLIAVAIWLIASGSFQASTGLGFTLDIISSALGVLLKYLIEKLWHFDDLYKTSGSNEGK